MKSRIVEMMPEHFVKDLHTPGEIMAFIDIEQTKEILSRSFFPKKHPNKLKFQNICYYLLHPEDYRNYNGSIMLRNMENIKKDKDEISQILLDEAIRIKGFTYESKQIYTPKGKTDEIEITIDSFIWSPFKFKFEGFLIEKKVDFLVPSANYSLLLNLRIMSKPNLYRKVCFDVQDLKRNCMNYVHIFEEQQSADTINHIKSGTIGLYIL